MKKRHLGPWWAKKGPPDGNRVFWEEIGSHWGAHGHYRSKERLARWHFSYEKSDIFDVGTMRAEMHMKKIEERMKQVNGKPYLRTKIALRVIVWWPFCDFFKKNLIPALVKVTIGQCGTRKRYKHFFNRCHFFQGKSIHFEMRAATNKFSVEDDVLGIARFTWARDTFFLTIAKTKQEGQERKSRK